MAVRFPSFGRSAGCRRFHRLIVLVGLQGSGKTTTAAKLARRLKQEQMAPFLVAADVYRPADVVFMVEGEVIRHRGGEERSS